MSDLTPQERPDQERPDHERVNPDAPAAPHASLPYADIDPAAPPAERGRASHAVAWIALVLVVANAGGLAWIATHPPAAPPAPQDERIASLVQDQSSLTQKLDGLSSQVADLAHRPAAAPAPAFDPAPLQGQLDQLKASIQQVQQDIARATSLATAAQDSVQKSDQSDQAAIEGVNGKITALSGNLDALSTRLDHEGAAARQVASLAANAERLARLQAASVALSIGRPIGQIPNAPPALARFATDAPPTEAALILAFPDAAAATLKASEPETQGQTFFKRLWTRAQSAVTVRDGDHVLVGDPAAGIVAAARQRLAAGDLDGAVATLGALSGPAADAMDPWRSKAASLVDAHAALASLMARPQ